MAIKTEHEQLLDQIEVLLNSQSLILTNVLTRGLQNAVTIIQDEINQLKGNIQTMALDISALTNAVANETTVEQSAITLIGGLAAQIQTLINASGDTVDPAALQALVTQMTSSQTALAAAVTANTPTTTTTPAPPPAAAPTA